MASFTCITCRVAFACPEIQRAHYKSDWHRYNLKRKVAEMPPVTSDEFCQRVQAQQAKIVESQLDGKTHCQVCNKHFNTENSFINHMKSKKHREQEGKLQKEIERQKEKRIEKGLDELEDKNNQKIEELPNKIPEAASAAVISTRKKPTSNAEDNNEDMEVEEVSDDEWNDVEGEAIPATDCLFCPHSSKTVDDNTHHMTVQHSFFIPYIEYLVDLEGLLTYLGNKVGSGFVCLWCNERGKSFHTLDAVQRHMTDKGHYKVQFDGDSAFEYSDFYDYRSSYPDHDEKMDDETMEEVVTEDSLHHTSDGYQLQLPSGAKIGHRELFRYYKQNVPPTRAVVKNNGAINRLNMQYKALGWTSSTGRGGEAKLMDLRFMQRFKAKPRLAMGIKNNKIKQKHLRPQVIF